LVVGLVAVGMWASEAGRAAAVHMSTASGQGVRGTCPPPVAEPVGGPVLPVVNASGGAAVRRCPRAKRSPSTGAAGHRAER
jgi:hypothetical protein